MNECQDWDDWVNALTHGNCARCEKYFMDNLLYNFCQRTYIDTFEGVPIITEFAYRVCSNCMFDLISHRYLEGRQNG